MDDKPFRDQLAEIMQERGVSQRDLVKLIRKHADWGSRGTISLILTGDLAPTRHSIAGIAAGLGMKPEHFAEFRMAKLRENLDPRQVGWAKALRTLRKVEGAG